MRLVSNCSVGPRQAKLKIISEQMGREESGTLPLKSGRNPNGVSQREAWQRGADWAEGLEFS